MPILNSVAKTIAKPFPRAIAPASHAILDYFTAASLLVAAGFFWHRNKRAALGALICGGAELGVSLLTDYPGGVTRAISFRTHREIDMGLGAMTATMPTFMAFGDEREKRFFQFQGALITGIAALTHFPSNDKHGEGEHAKVA